MAEQQPEEQHPQPEHQARTPQVVHPAAKIGYQQLQLDQQPGSPLVAELPAQPALHFLRRRDIGLSGLHPCSSTKTGMYGARPLIWLEQELNKVGLFGTSIRNRTKKV